MMCDDYKCYFKLLEYVEKIYERLDQGYIHDLYNEHNELKRMIGNVLITLANKTGMDKEMKHKYKSLVWDNSFYN